MKNTIRLEASKDGTKKSSKSYKQPTTDSRQATIQTKKKHMIKCMNGYFIFFLEHKRFFRNQNNFWLGFRFQIASINTHTHIFFLRNSFHFRFPNNCMRFSSFWNVFSLLWLVNGELCHTKAHIALLNSIGWHTG